MGAAVSRESVEPMAMTAGKAARLLGLNRSTIYLMIHSGRLDAVEISDHRYIIPIASINKLLGDVRKPKDAR